MSKHTPAPWRIHEYKALDPFYDVVSESKNIAVIIGTQRFGDDARIPRNDESQANARLIASAPELLEVLKAFVNVCDSANPMNFINEIGALIEPARQAIAKAEGKP
jgi:hypothetical protein